MATDLFDRFRQALTAQSSRQPFHQRYLAVLLKSGQSLPDNGNLPSSSPAENPKSEPTVTQQLASVAFRELPMGYLPDAFELSGGQKRVGLLRPSLGEAYARAVVEHTLGHRAGIFIQSFGMSPRTVVEHCLESLELRRRRDLLLVLVSLAFGWSFFPGVMLWLAALWIRSLIRPGAAALRSLPVAAIVAMAVWLAVRGLPGGSWLSWYSRFVLLAPVVGWSIAKDLVLRSAVNLRARLLAVLDGTPVADRPSPVYRRRSTSRIVALEELDAEQDSNVLLSSDGVGILGLGRRWGRWRLEEDLTARDGIGIQSFKAGEIIDSVITNLLDQHQLSVDGDGDIGPSIRNWVVIDTSGRTGRIQRPTGVEVEGFNLSAAEVLRAKDSMLLGKDRQHRLGAQYSLHGGRLVVTFLVSATVVDAVLEVEVSAYALGPPSAQLISQPGCNWSQVLSVTRFRKSEFPVDSGEVARLLTRAYFSWTPALLGRLGGTLSVPEPFGLRHGWAIRPWTDRFMADDALRIATPVLRTIHTAIMEVMDSGGVDTERFNARAWGADDGSDTAMTQNAEGQYPFR